MIHRNIEKSLNLLAVQIHRENSIGAGGDEQIRHEFGGDRHARLVLAVLPGVAIKGQDRGDPLGGGAARSVDHDEQLDQVVIAGRTGGLDDEDIVPTNVLVDFHERLAIWEAGDGRLAERFANGATNLLGQWPVGITRKNFKPRIGHGAGILYPDGPGESFFASRS